MKKEYTVFGQHLAGALMADGFVLKRLEKNKNDTRKNIFIFNESESLLEFVKRYKLKHSK